MNPLVVMAIAHHLRTSIADVDPIEVFPLGHLQGWGELWGIHEGRHRWMGSYIAGRTDIPVDLCQRLPEPAPVELP